MVKEGNGGDNSIDKRRGLRIVRNEEPLNFNKISKAIEDEEGDKNEEIDLDKLDLYLAQKKITKEEHEKLWRQLTVKLQFDRKRLKEVHGIDGLTGLSERVEPVLNKLISELNYSGEHRSSHLDSVVVVYLDINDFKKINDTLGHKAGNEVIRAIVDRIKSVIKEGTDLFFRLHGDEFAIVFPITNNEKISEEVIKRIFSRIYNKMNTGFVVNLGGKNVELTVSAGYTRAIRGEQVTAEELLDRADKEMYKAKEKYRQKTGGGGR